MTSSLRTMLTKDIFESTLIIILVVMGLYLPTSIGEVISSQLLIFAFVTLFFILVLLFVRPSGIGHIVLVLNSLLILIVLLLSTISSPFKEYTIGTIAGYGCLSLLLSLKLREIRLSHAITAIFIFINFINISISFLIFFNQATVRNFIFNYYSFFYDELLTQMITWYNKPVLTFATHSLASFFFFIFFYLNLKTFALKNNFLYLIFAMSYIFLLFLLLSVSSSILGIFGLIILLHYGLKKHFIIIGSSLVLVFSFITVYAYKYLPVGLVWDIGINIMTDKDGGFLGRFSSSSGSLLTNIAYLIDHPFSPVGMSYSSSLFYGDSGPIEYLLRGSVILLISIYFGLFYFLRSNMVSKKNAFLLFGFIVMFEIGYTTLTYFRFLYLLPFIVIYLNGLERESEVVSR